MSMIRSFTRWLDRPGRRSVRGLLASLVGSARLHRRFRVRPYDRLWLSEHPDGLCVVSPDVKVPAPRPPKLDSWFEKVCLFDYTPGAGEVAIDLGAGIGDTTYFLSRLVGPQGLVVAIEGNPRSFYCLHELCRRNALTNVVSIHAIVADEPGLGRIEDGESLSDANSIFSGSGVSVMMTTLDTIVRDLALEQVDYLKINIEGAEELALRGMESSLERVRHVCVSCHDFRSEDLSGMRPTRKPVRRLLERHGFEIRSNPEARGHHADYLYARRP